MKESQLLKLDQAIQLLCDAADTKSPAAVSYLRNGKWEIANSTLSEVTDTGLEIDLAANVDPSLAVHQPIGVSLQVDHIKYIFETRITEAHSNVSDGKNKSYTLALPDRIEMMQRRASTRVPTPKTLSVNVTLWDRGYNDNQVDEPSENYWQGTLVDLSAGGLLTCIDPDSAQYFKQDQYLGLQFTPMCYQKPITLEGKINRIDQCDETGNLNIAVEFMGLEATSQGRDKIHRLISIINTYSMQNKGMITTTDATEIAAQEAASLADVDVEINKNAMEFSE